MNIRECRQCHRMVDFDEPWCDHETMEESAWRDINSRIGAAAFDKVVDDEVGKAAIELGHSAGKFINDKIREDLSK
jgi:predicted hydrocarbon binding protein